MPNRIRPRLVSTTAALVVTVSASAAIAGDPTFGSRTDKPDGSSALTVGRRLSTPWETKVGADVGLAAPSAITASDHLARGGVAEDRSSGAVWGNLTMPGLTMPGLRPLGFDKTSVEARVDGGKDEGKLGATLSRSVPINQDLSVTLQNSYSVKQSLATSAMGVPHTANIPDNAAPAPAWGVEQTVRLNVDPSGTTFSAGAGSSTVDSQWHNKLSVEQTLVGPLKLTTSIEDAGTTTPTKSITAGFKRTW